MFLHLQQATEKSHHIFAEVSDYLNKLVKTLRGPWWPVAKRNNTESNSSTSTTVTEAGPVVVGFTVGALPAAIMW